VRKSGTSPLIHPPWEEGQYVTYFLQREDGSWLAVALRVVGEVKKRIWGLEALFRSPRTENLVLFRWDEAAAPGEMDLVPVSEGTLRGSTDHHFDLPMLQATLVMNLMSIRTSEGARKALAEEPIVVTYPCGITSAHRLTVPPPPYQKNYDLNPRVLITGVARLSIDDHRSPMTVTSCGCNVPEPDDPESFEDFIDFSHPQEVDHGEFSLTYPATWFLHPDAAAPEGNKPSLGTRVGGVSCAATLTVRLHRGPDARIDDVRRKTLDEMSAACNELGADLAARRLEPLADKLNSESFIAEYDHSTIEGMIRTGLYPSDEGDRLAEVLLFGCVFKQHRFRTEILDGMNQCFTSILESFRFG
jgi:hypothetical protein